MPATTITINREQRDGLYELIRNHLGSVGKARTRLVKRGWLEASGWRGNWELTERG